MAANSAPVVVSVRPAWKSRINQIAVAVFGLAVPIGSLTPFLPQPYKGYSIAAVSILGAFGLWYYRTFQTSSVTPSSVASITTRTPALSDVMRAAGSSETSISDALNTESAAEAAAQNGTQAPSTK